MPTMTPRSHKTSRAERIGEAVTAAYIHELARPVSVARPVSLARPVALHMAPSRLRSPESSRRRGVQRQIAA